MEAEIYSGKTMQCGKIYVNTGINDAATERAPVGLYSGCAC